MHSGLSSNHNLFASILYLLPHFIPRILSRRSASFYSFNEYITHTAEMFHSSQLSLATTTDEGILWFSSNQMSGNGNVSRRSSLFMHKNIFHPVSLGNR